MNKSKYINPRKCRTCGKCCKTFSICYPKKLKEKDLILFSEIQRFNDLDTNKIEIIEKDKVVLVKFNFPCKHLKYKNGIHSCEIYTKDRPELCKEYPYEDTTDCPFIEVKNEK